MKVCELSDLFNFQKKDRKIRIYDASTLQLKLTFGGTDHLDSVEWVAFLHIISGLALEQRGNHDSVAHYLRWLNRQTMVMFITVICTQNTQKILCCTKSILYLAQTSFLCLEWQLNTLHSWGTTPKYWPHPFQNFRNSNKALFTHWTHRSIHQSSWKFPLALANGTWLTHPMISFFSPCS